MTYACAQYNYGSVNICPLLILIRIVYLKFNMVMGAILHIHMHSTHMEMIEVVYERRTPLIVTGLGRLHACMNISHRWSARAGMKFGTTRLSKR